MNSRCAAGPIEAPKPVEGSALYELLRARQAALAADPAGVERVLQAGAQRARNTAAPVIAAIRGGVSL